MPAAKHLDPVLGVDVHIVMIPSPAGPIPTPLPHPYVGMLLDPADYVPIIGATVKVNGLPRAVAGTSGQATPPHMPMGGPFMKPPTCESEMFMGSLTVNADGDPMGFAALPVLSCQDIGIPAPLRPKRKSPAKSLMLPVSLVMPIPGGPPVMVGGPPVPLMPGVEVLIGPLCKGLVKARRALAKKSDLFARSMWALSERLKALANVVFKKLGLDPHGAARNKVERAICAVTGHPVDIASGKVFTDFTDLELLGPFPFRLERVWFSTSTYQGPFGHGWHASCDMGLATSDKVVGVRLADGRVALFPPIATGTSHYEPNEQLTLSRDLHGYALTDNRGLTYRFYAHPQRADQPLAAIIDRGGHVVSFQQNERGQLARIIDSSRRPWDLHYDATQKITTVENSLGQKTTYMHDGAMVHKVVDARGHTRQTEYDDAYRRVATSDALGQRSTFVYDERGNLTSMTGPDGASLRVENGPHDLPVRASDPMQGEWTWTRDERGRVTERRDPLGRTTKYHYTGPWLVGVTDPAGAYTGIGYDPAGNVDAIGTFSGAITRYHHDLLGRVVGVTDPRGNTQTRELDPLGRALRVNESDGNVRNLEYDGEGNVTHAKDTHHDVQFTYQGMGRMRSRSEAGTTVSFEYDTEEQLTGIANEHGLVYRFLLGPTGDVDEESGFDGLMRKYTRDNAGRVLRVERPGARFSEYKYDPAGRVVSVKHSDGTRESYGYRADGELISAANQSASVLFERDVLGRIVREQQGGHQGYRIKFDLVSSPWQRIQNDTLLGSAEICPKIGH